MTSKLKMWEAQMAKTPGARWRVRSQRADGPFEVENEGTFDELVVDHWLHVEQMEERAWLIRIGDQGIWVDVKPDGEVGVRFVGPPKDLQDK